MEKVTVLLCVCRDGGVPERKDHISEAHVRLWSSNSVLSFSIHLQTELDPEFSSSPIFSHENTPNKNYCVAKSL